VNKILAILAMITLLSMWPLAAAGEESSSELQMSPGHEESALSGENDIPGGDTEDQSETSGDPHNLGGGFRGLEDPLAIPPIWVAPFVPWIFTLV
jgi:hypothetical protein